MTLETQQTWVFDRYVNGVLMAEDVEVARASSFEEAAVIAARLAARGPNGETPVLILRTSFDVMARVATLEKVGLIREEEWATFRDAIIAERDRLTAELAQARADAKAAVAVVVEKAAAICEPTQPLPAKKPTMADDPMGLFAYEVSEMALQDVAEIRALAPEDAIAEVARIRAERDDAQREAVELATFMARTFHPDVPQWRPLDYPAGVISQIDNMVAGLAAELAAAQEREARLADAAMPFLKNAVLADNRALIRAVDRLRAALAQPITAPPTEYERKLAQMKEDFPNGI